VVRSSAAKWSWSPFGGVLNLCLGAVCMACGISGKLLFMGFDSSWPFTVLGAVFAVVGGFRLWRWWMRVRADAKKAVEPAHDDLQEDASKEEGSPP